MFRELRESIHDSIQRENRAKDKAVIKAIKPYEDFIVEIYESLPLGELKTKIKRFMYEYDITH